MEKNTRTQQVQKPRPLIDLIYDCGNALNNPIWVNLVNEGLSPESTDSHVRSLGWSNKTAETIRSMCYLRDQHKETWRDLTNSNKRPMTMFSFEKLNTPIQGRYPDGILPLYGAKNLIMGSDLVNYENLPLFMREFSFGPVTEDCDCSFDPWKKIDFSHPDQGYNPEWLRYNQSQNAGKVGITFDYRNDPAFSNNYHWVAFPKLGGSERVCNQYEHQPCADWISGIQITSALIARHIPDKKFPAIYKQVEFAQKLPVAKTNVVTMNRLILTWQFDQNPEKINETLGSAVFERRYTMKNDNIVGIRFPFNVSPWQLKAKWLHTWTPVFGLGLEPSVYRTQVRLGTNEETKWDRTNDAKITAFEDFDRLYEAGRSQLLDINVYLNLEKILGKDLYENPEKDIFETLCGLEQEPKLRKMGI